MLTVKLRGLEHDGLVKRTVYASVPPKVEYKLTAVGALLVELLRAPSEWALRNQPALEKVTISVVTLVGLVRPQ